jgi:uncharacterized protein
MAVSRRTFLKGAGAAALAGAGTVFYGHLAADRFIVERHQITLARLPAAFDGLTIAHITDLHFGEYFHEADLQSIVATINQLSPDVVALTGDFVTHPNLSRHRARAVEDGKRCARLLGGLRPRLGSFAVLGNHDFVLPLSNLARDLAAGGTRLLRNSALPLERGGARIWVAGLDDAIAGRPKAAATLAQVAPGEAVVLLVHEPDVADGLPPGFDLQLSGHSHGGQVCMPFGYPVFLPHLARKYPAGLYRVGDLHLFTSRGVGTTQVPMRLNCPPTVDLLTLRSSQLSRIPDGPGQ